MDLENMLKKSTVIKGNKKVRNATSQEYNGIAFKSKLEVGAYKLLTEAGFNPEYEVDKFEFVKSFKLDKVRVFIPKGNKLEEFTTKIRAMTFTPDFIISTKGYYIIFEVKGQPNDVYPVKRKLFFKMLEDSNIKDILFFEPHSLRQVKEAIEIIQGLPDKSKGMDKIQLFSKMSEEHLSDNDNKIAQALIAKRDFFSLYQLVSSGIVRHKKRVTVPDEKSDLKLSNLEHLELMLIDYLVLIEDEDFLDYELEYSNEKEFCEEEY